MWILVSSFSELSRTSKNKYLWARSDTEGGSNEPGEGGRVSVFWGLVFSPKKAKRGSVNFVFMLFSITFFPGRVCEFRLKGESLPSKGLKGSDFPLLLRMPLYVIISTVMTSKKKATNKSIIFFSQISINSFPNYFPYISYPNKFFQGF